VRAVTSFTERGFVPRFQMRRLFDVDRTERA
jgi:hypothetical protein